MSKLSRPLELAIRQMRANVIFAVIKRRGGDPRFTHIERMTEFMSDKEILAAELGRIRRPWWRKIFSDDPALPAGKWGPPNQA